MLTYFTEEKVISTWTAAASGLGKEEMNKNKKKERKSWLTWKSKVKDLQVENVTLRS